MNEPGGPVCGVFTYRLLQALRRAPSDMKGNVFAKSVKDYIHSEWPQGGATSDFQPAIEIEPDDMVLAVRSEIATMLTSVTITIKSPVPSSGDVVIHDGQLKEMMCSPLVGDRINGLLPAGFYKATLVGTSRTVLFQAIGEHVDERI